MDIEVKKPTQDELERLGVFDWGTWESPVRTFAWEYTSTEVCYFLEGRVIVKTDDGDEIEIGKGDLVRFPKGLKCVWNVLEPVKKHFKFE